MLEGQLATIYKKTPVTRQMSVLVGFCLYFTGYSTDGNLQNPTFDDGCFSDLLLKWSQRQRD